MSGSFSDQQLSHDLRKKKKNQLWGCMHGAATVVFSPARNVHATARNCAQLRATTRAAFRLQPKTAIGVHVLQEHLRSSRSGPEAAQTAMT